MSIPPQAISKESYFQHGGVARGVDPDVASDIGYVDPADVTPEYLAEAARTRRLLDIAPHSGSTAMCYECQPPREIPCGPHTERLPNGKIRTVGH